MAVESFTERARRKRREALANWTVDDERQWLADHPEDEPVLDVGPAEGAEPEREWDATLIPDIEVERSAQDREIDNFLDTINIVDAYNKWAGKGTVHNPGNKREGVMVRCPNPSHPDQNPSAWLNLDEQVYVCGGCGMEGGDKFHIAAYALGVGVPIPTSKFPELKKRMAESMGFQVKQIGTKQYVERMEVEQEDEPAKPVEPVEQPVADDKTEPKSPEQPTSPPKEPLKSRFPNKPQTEDQGEVPADPAPAQAPDPAPTTIATVHPITPQAGDEDAPSVRMPSFDYKGMLHPDTFLSRWMESAATDHMPDEYYFWLGMVALGLAVKDRAVLDDTPPVKANMYVCLTGATGIGKSRTTQKLKALLREALPQGDEGAGVRLLPSPASAEALIDCFNVFDRDVATLPSGETQEIIIRHKIAGLVDFNELSVLIGRSSRVGSTLKPTLLEFFDAYGDVTNTSRTHGTVEAREPFASIIATTQPGSIRELLVDNDAESGFLNRWIFVGGVAETPNFFQKGGFDPAFPADKLKTIANRYNHVAQDDPPIKYEFEPDAERHAEEYLQSVLWPVKQTEGNDLLSRSDLMVKKFAFLFAIDRELAKVDLKCVTDAISLWEYMTRMYELIGAEIGVGEFDYCKRAIFKAIDGFVQRQGKGPKPKQLIAAMNRDTRFGSDLIEKVLNTMVRMGEVEETSSQTPDGSVVVRYVNAAV